MTPTPVHLSGAKCGDHVLFQGEEIGVIHCWADDGAHVRLADSFLRKFGPWYVPMPPEGDKNNTMWMLEASFVRITDEQFSFGEFTVVPF